MMSRLGNAGGIVAPRVFPNYHELAFNQHKWHCYGSGQWVVAVIPSHILFHELFSGAPVHG
jgi:hypothetical protein